MWEKIVKVVDFHLQLINQVAACNWWRWGKDGGQELKNLICILGNNIINQKVKHLCHSSCLIIWNISIYMCSCLPCFGCGTVCWCLLVSSESSPDSSNSAPLISGDKIFHEWSSKLKVGPKEVFICDYYLFFFVSKHQQNSAHTFDKFVMCNFKITRLLICRLKCEIWMFQDFPDEIWNGSIY